MSLAGKAARGALWTILSSLGGRAIGVVGTLIITRFLDPDVMGDVGTATILVMTVSWLTSWGFGQYVIVKGRGPDRDAVVWHATVFTLGLGAFALGGAALVAWLAEPHVHARAIAEYMPPMALAIGIRRASAIPEKLLSQKMQFRAIGLTIALGELTYAIVTIAFATHGYGGWSVVYGNLAQYTVMSGIIFGATRFADWLTPRPWSWHQVRAMLRFGMPLAGEGIAHQGARYWDNVTVRAVYGAHATGLYNLAYNLADVPAVHVGEQIGAVLLPSLANMPPERRPRAFERATGLLSIIIFPLACGLGAVSNSLVRLALSREWQDVAPLLTVLAVLSVFRPVGWVVSSYLQAQERNKPLMYLEFGKLVIVVGGIAVMSPFGLRASACAVGVAFGLQALAGVWLVLQNGPRPRVLLSGFLRPLVCCAAMGAAVIGLRVGLRSYGVHHPGILLTAEIVIGVLVYVPLALVVCRQQSRDLLNVVREMLSRRSVS